jgi:tetratricopeptide (TPR) repeat protein
MTDEESILDENGANSMLRDALEALHLGERARARDLLTRLIKTDQKNPTYWLWLSTAVDTDKERIYCLQTALQADPDNEAVKRGLHFYGALPPDDSIKPFPINHPRSWEEKLTIPKEPKGKRGSLARPILRVTLLLFIAIGVLIILYMGGSNFLFKKPAQQSYITRTHHPTFTLPLTATVTPQTRTPTPTFMGATPLWMFLDSTYTPTPLYVVTVHPITSRSAFESGLRFLAAEDYTNAMVLFQQAKSLEPEAPDIYYYIGEIYRAQGDFRNARDSYQDAINKDAEFAPAFLGRARALLGLNPQLDVLADLDEAVLLDPNFSEAYIERGRYTLTTNPYAAQADLEKAIEITPSSALAYLYLADAELILGQYDAALSSAVIANQLDLTLVPVYLTLGRAYIFNDQSDQAISVLQTYTKYAPEDYYAYQLLGTVYNDTEQYEAAMEILTTAITAGWKNTNTYYQRGSSHLNLDEAQLAEADFKLAIIYDDQNFDAYIGLAKALDQLGQFGAAYVQVELNAYPLAKNDGMKAQVYYWEAQYLEEQGDPKSLIGAKTAWYQLISLPPEVMPAAWRNQAYQHLNITPTYTPTLRITLTARSTDTRVPTSTSSP